MIPDKNAVYINTKQNIRGEDKRSLPKFAALILTLAAFFVTLSSISSLSLINNVKNNNSIETYNSSAITVNAIDVCNSKDKMGDNMEPHAWYDFILAYPQKQATNRIWTAQEIFSGKAMYVKYGGEDGSADKGLMIFKAIDVGKDRGKDFGNAFTSKLPDLSKDRTAFNCLSGFSMVETFISNSMLGLSNFISNMTSKFVVMAFNSGLVCNAGSDQDACIDLVSIIGGKSGTNDTGIIGTLTDGIYFPMIVIIAAIAAFVIFYNGIIKHQVRQAFGQAAWVVLAVIVGLAFLLNPALLAKAPMTVSNSVAGCVIGAVNGDNCFNSSTSTPSSTISGSQKICISDGSNISVDQKISMNINSLSCDIWKAFILEPYAEGSFGQSFESLDVKDSKNTDVINAAKAANINTDTFCVPLGTTESFNDAKKSTTLNLDYENNKVCNLALYQMFLLTDAKTSSSVAPSGLDTRWYNVILTTVNNPRMWVYWNGTNTGSALKLISAFSSLFCTIAGSVVLIVTSAFAMMYYILSIILIAFAPLFFLIGVIPGKGKSLFLGWAEQIISNILKYLVSALFLLISLIFYAAVLKNATNPPVTVIFVLILTMALLVYRKELINLFGRVNMGGQQLSTNFVNGARNTLVGKRVDRRIGRTKDASKKLVHGAKGVAGAAVGTAIAGGNIKTGMKDAAQRELRRSNGFIGNVERSRNQISNDNRRDLTQKIKDLRNQKNNDEKVLQSAQQDNEKARLNVSAAEQVYHAAQANKTIDTNAAQVVKNRAQDNFDNLKKDATATIKVEHEEAVQTIRLDIANNMLSNIKNNSNMSDSIKTAASYVQKEVEIDQLKNQLTKQTLNNDSTENIEKTKNRIATLNSDLNKIGISGNDAEVSNLRSLVDKNTENKINDTNDSNYDNDVADYLKDQRDDFKNYANDLEMSRRNLDIANQRLNKGKNEDDAIVKAKDMVDTSKDILAETNVRLAQAKINKDQSTVAYETASTINERFIPGQHVDNVDKMGNYIDINKAAQEAAQQALTNVLKDNPSLTGKIGIQNESIKMEPYVETDYKAFNQALVNRGENPLPPPIAKDNNSGNSNPNTGNSNPNPSGS